MPTEPCNNHFSLDNLSTLAYPKGAEAVGAVLKKLNPLMFRSLSPGTLDPPPTHVQLTAIHPILTILSPYRDPWAPTGPLTVQPVFKIPVRGSQQALLH